MCTTTKECPVLQTAEQDIIVYKLVIEIPSIFGSLLCIKSLYSDFKYYPNVIAYSELDEFYLTSCGWVSTRAFYSYKYKGTKSRLCSNACFVIPKGAKYYLCKDIDSGDYIYHSDQIMFKELI